MSAGYVGSDVRTPGCASVLSLERGRRRTTRGTSEARRLIEVGPVVDSFASLRREFPPDAPASAASPRVQQRAASSSGLDPHPAALARPVTAVQALCDHPLQTELGHGAVERGAVSERLGGRPRRPIQLAPRGSPCGRGTASRSGPLRGANAVLRALPGDELAVEEEPRGQPPQLRENLRSCSGPGGCECGSRAVRQRVAVRRCLGRHDVESASGRTRGRRSTYDRSRVHGLIFASFRD